jgi:hypothetical protein
LNNDLYVQLSGFAWNRLWANGRLAKLEIFIWSLFGVYFSFKLFGFYFILIDGPLFIIPCLAIFFLTPVMMGAWIYKVHASERLADEEVRITPINPSVLIRARMVTVRRTWLRIFLPLTILTFYGFFLTVYPTLSIRNLIWSSIVAIPLIVGWVAIPLSWGFYWGSKNRMGRGSFLTGYYSYLAVIAFILFVIFAERQKTTLSSQAFSGESIFYIVTAVVVLISIVTSRPLYRMSCSEWGRRI